MNIPDIKIIRTDSDNQDFLALMKLLDDYLRIEDGDDHVFYAQFNKPDKINHAVVAYYEGKPVGIGALRKYEDSSVEIKRMFVDTTVRRQGIAKKILTSLENWATEQGFTTCILETGKRQPEAIALYQRMGYTIIPNYGQYAGKDNSICFSKPLSCNTSFS